MSQVARFLSLCQNRGSTIRYHRDESMMACACRTPEGFRDPVFHAQYPDEPICNEEGMLPYFTDGFLAVVTIPGGAEQFMWSPWVPNYLTISMPQFNFLLGQPVDHVVATTLDIPGVSYYTTYLVGDPRVAATAAGLTLPDNTGTRNPTGSTRNTPTTGTSGVSDFNIKGFMQPIQSTRATRLSTEQLRVMFGEIQADDHLGIFPYEWAGKKLDFYDWGRSGEDYVEYNGRRFTVVNANLIPDPSDGNPAHHWEVGARLMTSEPLT
jgi:hypothetical protein